MTMSKEGWEETTLGEIATIIMGQSPSGETCNETGDGIPLLNGPTEFGSFHPCPVQSTTDPKKFAEVGDLLFCVRGSTTGRMNWADERYAIGRGLASLRHKNGAEFQPFLRGLIDYYLPSLLTEATGSTFPNVSGQQLVSLPIKVPDIPTQRHIASILSALDEKIELNRQTNATLEAIAQAIFKEWFVDFHFSGATGDMQDSELGPIPKGWMAEQLGTISKIKHGFAFKGEYFSEEETDDILLTPGNFKVGGGFNHAKFKYYAGEYPSEYVLRRHDLLVTMTDLSKNGDTLGFPALVPLIDGKNVLHNQRIGKVETDRDDSWKLYLYFVMQQKTYRDYVLSGATGSTVRHTSPSRILDHLIVMPPSPVLHSFENVIKPLVDKIDYGQRESTILTQIRDRVLPKLMAGEIAV
jgi:type I restriction enzyme, S subunit